MAARPLTCAVRAAMAACRPATSRSSATSCCWSVAMSASMAAFRPSVSITQDQGIGLLSMLVHLTDVRVPHRGGPDVDRTRWDEPVLEGEAASRHQVIALRGDSNPSEFDVQALLCRGRVLNKKVGSRTICGQYLLRNVGRCYGS